MHIARPARRRPPHRDRADARPNPPPRAEALGRRVFLDAHLEHAGHEAAEPDGAGAVPSAAVAAPAVAGAGPNIRVTEVFLTDSDFNRFVGTPIEGQSYGIRVSFETESLPAGAQ